MTETREYSPEEYTYSTKIGIAIGFVLGLVMGAAIVLFINSPALNHWPRIATIVIWQAIGWGLFGMIAGSGGIFADLRLPRRVPQQTHRTSELAGKPTA